MLFATRPAPGADARERERLGEQVLTQGSRLHTPEPAAAERHVEISARADTPFDVGPVGPEATRPPNVGATGVGRSVLVSFLASVGLAISLYASLRTHFTGYSNMMGLLASAATVLAALTALPRLHAGWRGRAGLASAGCLALTAVLVLQVARDGHQYSAMHDLGLAVRVAATSPNITVPYHCGRDGFDETFGVHDGEAVRVRDEHGRIIGSGVLTEGTRGAVPSFCEWGVAISVHGASKYSIEVGNPVWAFDYHRSDFESNSYQALVVLSPGALGYCAPHHCLA